MPRGPFVIGLPSVHSPAGTAGTLPRGLCPSAASGDYGMGCLRQQMVALRAKLHAGALNILKRFL